MQCELFLLSEINVSERKSKRFVNNLKIYSFNYYFITPRLTKIDVFVDYSVISE